MISSNSIQSLKSRLRNHRGPVIRVKNRCSYRFIPSGLSVLLMYGCILSTYANRFYQRQDGTPRVLENNIFTLETVVVTKNITTPVLEQTEDITVLTPTGLANFTLITNDDRNVTNFFDDDTTKVPDTNNDTSEDSPNQVPLPPFSIILNLGGESGSTSVSEVADDLNRVLTNYLMSKLTNNADSGSYPITAISLQVSPVLSRRSLIKLNHLRRRELNAQSSNAMSFGVTGNATVPSNATVSTQVISSSVEDALSDGTSLLSFIESNATTAGLKSVSGVSTDINGKPSCSPCLIPAPITDPDPSTNVGKMVSRAFGYVLLAGAGLSVFGWVYIFYLRRESEKQMRTREAQIQNKPMGNSPSFSRTSHGTSTPPSSQFCKRFPRSVSTSNEDVSSIDDVDGALLQHVDDDDDSFAQRLRIAAVTENRGKGRAGSKTPPLNTIEDNYSSACYDTSFLSMEFASVGAPPENDVPHLSNASESANGTSVFNDEYANKDIFFINSHGKRDILQDSVTSGNTQDSVENTTELSSSFENDYVGFCLKQNKNLSSTNEIISDEEYAAAVLAAAREIQQSSPIRQGRQTIAEKSMDSTNDSITYNYQVQNSTEDNWTVPRPPRYPSAALNADSSLDVTSNTLNKTNHCSFINSSLSVESMNSNAKFIEAHTSFFYLDVDTVNLPVNGDSVSNASLVQEELTTANDTTTAGYEGSNSDTFQNSGGDGNESRLGISPVGLDKSFRVSSDKNKSAVVDVFPMLNVQFRKDRDARNVDEQVKKANAIMSSRNSTDSPAKQKRVMPTDAPAFTNSNSVALDSTVPSTTQIRRTSSPDHEGNDKKNENLIEPVVNKNHSQGQLVASNNTPTFRIQTVESPLPSTRKSLPKSNPTSSKRNDTSWLKKRPSLDDAREELQADRCISSLRVMSSDSGVDSPTLLSIKVLSSPLHDEHIDPPSPSKITIKPSLVKAANVNKSPTPRFKDSASWIKNNSGQNRSASVPPSRSTNDASAQLQDPRVVQDTERDPMPVWMLPKANKNSNRNGISTQAVSIPIPSIKKMSDHDRSVSVPLSRSINATSASLQHRIPVSEDTEKGHILPSSMPNTDKHSTGNGNSSPAVSKQLPPSSTRPSSSSPSSTNPPYQNLSIISSKPVLKDNYIITTPTRGSGTKSTTAGSPFPADPLQKLRSKRSVSEPRGFNSPCASSSSSVTSTLPSKNVSSDRISAVKELLRGSATSLIAKFEKCEVDTTDAASSAIFPHNEHWQYMGKLRSVTPSASIRNLFLMSPSSTKA